MRHRERPRSEPGTSKTRRKRDSLALQALGEALVDLSPEDLECLALPDRLRQAVLDARQIKKHEALRRQRQYIGRLMRDVDAEPIRQFLEARSDSRRQSTGLFHAAEEWRRRLLDGGTETVSECVDSLGVDPQKLADKLAAVRRAQTESLRKGAARDLFRFLHEAIRARAPGGDR